MNCQIQTSLDIFNCLKRTLITVRKAVLVRPELTGIQADAAVLL